jgi:hypothetical protein
MRRACDPGVSAWPAQSPPEPSRSGDLNSATTDIVFSVGSIIDGSEEVEDEELPSFRRWHLPQLMRAMSSFSLRWVIATTLEEFLGRPAPFPRESVYRTSFNATEHVALAQVGGAGVFRERRVRRYVPHRLDI